MRTSATEILTSLRIKHQQRQQEKQQNQQRATSAPQHFNISTQPSTAAEAVSAPPPMLGLAGSSAGQQSSSSAIQQSLPQVVQRPQQPPAQWLLQHSPVQQQVQQISQHRPMFSQPLALSELPSPQGPPGALEPRQEVATDRSRHLDRRAIPAGLLAHEPLIQSVEPSLSPGHFPSYHDFAMAQRGPGAQLCPAAMSPNTAPSPQPHSQPGRSMPIQAHSEANSEVMLPQPEPHSGLQSSGSCKYPSDVPASTMHSWFQTGRVAPRLQPTPGQQGGVHPAMEFLQKEFSWHPVMSSWQSLVYDILPAGGKFDKCHHSL